MTDPGTPQTPPYDPDVLAQQIADEAAAIDAAATQAPEPQQVADATTPADKPVEVTSDEIDPKVAYFANPVFLESYANLTQAVLKKVSELTKAELKEYYAGNSVEHQLVRTVLNPSENSFASSIGDDHSSAIKNSIEAGHVLKPISDTPYTDRMTRTSNQTDKLTGQRAVAAFTAMFHGFRKVNLLHSGFNITIRAPDLSELDTIFQSVDVSSQEYGRILGGHSVLAQDVLIKEQFMQVLPSLVTSSNLIGFDQNDVLMKAIRFHDYDIILAALCASMYPKGMSVSTKCMTDKCEHIIDDNRIAADRIRLVDMDRITTDMFEFTSRTDKTSLEDIHAYQAKLQHATRVIVDDLQLELKVPSMYEYITNQKMVLKRIMGAAHTSNEAHSTYLTRQSMLYNNYGLLPWVRSAGPLDELGELICYSEDPEAIYISLTRTDRPDNVENANRILEFISDSRLEHVCIPIQVCPSCNKRHAEYHGFDVQHYFFSVAGYRLVQTGVLV